MSLEQQIEAVLFYKAEPVLFSFLSDFLEIDDQTLLSALSSLSEHLSLGATQLVQTDNSVQLVISPEFSETIELLRKDEMKRDIGKAGAETLAIILYKGPVTRADIDRIRGVNSTFILRNLLMRGLIERRDNPKDQRSFLYATTPNLMNHLGIKKREELPEFSDILNTLDTFEKEQTELEQKPASLT